MKLRTLFYSEVHEEYLWAYVDSDHVLGTEYDMGSEPYCHE